MPCLHGLPLLLQKLVSALQHGTSYYIFYKALLRTTYRYTVLLLQVFTLDHGLLLCTTKFYSAPRGNTLCYTALLLCITHWFLCTTQHSSASALSPCQTVFTCYKAPLYYTATTLDPALQKTNVYTLAMIHDCGKELARVTFTHCMHLMQENQLLQVSA